MTLGRIEDRIKEKLASRSEKGLLRRLSPEKRGIDLSSNDYLGFARSAALRERVERKWNEYQGPLGAGGARLISGDSELYHELEREIAEFHQAPAALIFNSGYDANIGLFASIAGRNDTVIYDELVHASIRDGIRLSNAASYSFRHNDISDLEKKCRLAKGSLFVVVESVYSMDGDLAPLEELASFCERPGAALIVDEAHATGVFGERGEGLVQKLGLESKIFARVHTFGKALGIHGAAVLGSCELKSFLVNFARSFIYTTALPAHSLISVWCAYDLLKEEPTVINLLWERLMAFSTALASHGIEYSSTSPIHAIYFPGNETARAVAAAAQNAGFDIRAILSPTVPAGKERLRVCVHAFNSEDELKGAAKLLGEVKKSL